MIRKLLVGAILLGRGHAYISSASLGPVPLGAPDKEQVVPHPPKSFTVHKHPLKVSLDEEDSILRYFQKTRTATTGLTIAEDTTHHIEASGLRMDLVAEIYTDSPAYLHLLPGDGAGSTAASVKGVHLHGPRPPSKQPQPRLWITGFSLGSHQGTLKSMDPASGHVTRVPTPLLWPNEVTSVPCHLVPPTPSCLITPEQLEIATALQEELDCDGGGPYRDALLVADGFLVPGKDQGGIYMVQKPGLPGERTVCLTRSSQDWFYHRAVWVDLTGDGRQSILTARARVSHGRTYGELVWLECPAPYDSTEEGEYVNADGSPFDPFAKPWKTRVLHRGPDVLFSLVDLDETDDTIEVLASEFFGERVTLLSIERGEEPRVVRHRVIDDECGKAFGSLILHHEDDGDNKRLLVTTHEAGAGGSLFSYQIPPNWRTDPWIRTKVASGFPVAEQLGNLIHPGAPGFVYCFALGGQDYLAVAGDCAETVSIYHSRCGSYERVVELQCGATVGSLAIGEDEFCGSAGLTLYIPCFEKNKIVVFSMNKL